MWMMGYNDGGELNLTDSCNGRKLRPLIPRPTTSISATTTSNAPFLSRVHGADLLSLNHHHLGVTEQSKRDFNTTQQHQVVVSSRWNPTPEQLQTLEELYRRGTRTPNADQIQHITAQLRRYGKIEGKNVFYWFQNHKARERQKRRRQLESGSDEQQGTLERKESAGPNRTGFEAEQTKGCCWPLPTNCSTLSEKTASIQIRAAAARAAVSECRTDGWVQFDGGELPQRRSLLERNATWHPMMHLSSSPPHHLLNVTTSSSSSTTVATSKTLETLDPKLVTIGIQDSKIFMAPYREYRSRFGNEDGYESGGGPSSQTLELFPLRSGGEGNENAGEENEVALAAMNASFSTPYQFFEFLPLKN